MARKLDKDKIREEIRKEWIKEGEKFTEEELERAVQWEIDDRENNNNYVQSEEEPKKKREYNVKLDKEKVKILLLLENLINDKFNNIEIVNPQQEICFDYNNSIYSFKLSKHTNKWKKPIIKEQIQEQFNKIKEELKENDNINTKD